MDPWGQTPAVRQAAFKTPKSVRVAWLHRCGNRIDPEVSLATQSAVRMLEQAGAAVEEIELDFVSLEPHFITLLETLTASRAGPHLATHRDRMDPAIVALVERGLRRNAQELLEAGFARTRCFQDLQRVFERFDVLASPTVSAPPLHIDVDPEGLIDIDGRAEMTVRAAWYPYTFPMNLTGHPAISLPCGKSRLGLPIGLQLVGPWHSDDRLLQMAAWLESALGSGSGSSARIA